MSLFLPIIVSNWGILWGKRNVPYVRNVDFTAFVSSECIKSLLTKSRFIPYPSSFIAILNCAENTTYIK